LLGTEFVFVVPRPSARGTGHQVDSHWPAQRLVGGTDGDQSGHLCAFERDRRRDRQLVAAAHTDRQGQLATEPLAVIAWPALLLGCE
jgi:hypothetical protein